MIRVELVKAMDGEPVGVLLSPFVPQDGTVTLSWGDESEVWHVEGVVDVECRLDPVESVYELAVVRVAVTRSRFGSDGGAVKV